MKLKFLPLLLAGLWLSAPAQSDNPTVSELVENLARYHPEYLATLSRTEQVARQQVEADAAFDLQLEQNTFVRPSGFYDGAYAEQSIIQPIEDLGAQVFGTYRISDGTFPEYEGARETLDLGEASIGVKLSLLQNRDTDKRRLALTSAAFRYMEAESKQNVELNKLIFGGVSGYLSWYQSYRKLLVVRDLVELTRNRLRGVETRVESGDLASITLTEFNTTLLQRELLEREAEQAFELARQRLNYFWRTAEDRRVSDTRVDEPPVDIDWPYRSPSMDPALYDDLVTAHPAVRALEAKIDQARNKRLLARNETLPELDLEMKLARDIGDGSETLDGTESVVGVAFYMPLGQRAARAREAAANAQIRELEYESQVLYDQITRDVGLSLQALSYSRRILELSRRQEALAEKLLSQEQARFNEGVSDQFLLIARETAALQAHLKTVDAEVETLRQELALHATLAKLYEPPT